MYRFFSGKDRISLFSLNIHMCRVDKVHGCWDGYSYHSNKIVLTRLCWIIILFPRPYGLVMLLVFIKIMFQRLVLYDIQGKTKNTKSLCRVLTVFVGVAFYFFPNTHNCLDFVGRVFCGFATWSISRKLR